MIFIVIWRHYSFTKNTFIHSFHFLLELLNINIFFFFFRPHCELIAYVKYLLYKKGLTFSVTVFEFRVWYVLAFFLSFLKQPSPSIKSTYFYTIFPRLQCNIFSHIFLTFFGNIWSFTQN